MLTPTLFKIYLFINPQLYIVLTCDPEERGGGGGREEGGAGEDDGEADGKNKEK